MIRKLGKNVKKLDDDPEGGKNRFKQYGWLGVNMRAPGSWHGKNDISILKGR